MSQLFFYDYDHYDVVKCHRNLNFEKMDFVPYTGKNDGFWLLWGMSKKYIKQSIIKKSKYSFSCHLQINKKSIMQIKKDPRGKFDSNFAYESLVRVNLK